MKALKKVCSNIYLIFIFVLLYAPILTLMVLSFNQSKSRARWGGFTTQWYTELFQNEEILLAFRNTMIIAFLSALIASVHPILMRGRPNLSTHCRFDSLPTQSPTESLVFPVRHTQVPSTDIPPLDGAS